MIREYPAVPDNPGVDLWNVVFDGSKKEVRVHVEPADRGIVATTSRVSRTCTCACACTCTCTHSIRLAPDTTTRLHEHRHSSSHQHTDRLCVRACVLACLRACVHPIDPKTSSKNTNTYTPGPKSSTPERFHGTATAGTVQRVKSLNGHMISTSASIPNINLKVRRGAVRCGAGRGGAGRGGAVVNSLTLH